MEVITRAQAKDRGLGRYFTGKSCKRGHIVERSTSDATCVTCKLAAASDARTRNLVECRKRDKVRHSATREQSIAKKKAWRVANREEISAARKAYRVANRETMNEAKRVWRLRAKNEKSREIRRSPLIREWMAANPGRVRTHKHTSRAKRSRAIGRFSFDDIARIMKQQRGRCAMPWCRREIKGKYQIDHITPIKSGGTNWPRNLQLTCPHGCNQRKSAKDPIDHAREHGMLL